MYVEYTKNSYRKYEITNVKTKKLYIVFKIPIENQHRLDIYHTIVLLNLLLVSYRPKMY